MSTEVDFFCGFVLDQAVIIFSVHDDVCFCRASQDRGHRFIELTELLTCPKQTGSGPMERKKNKKIISNILEL